MAFTVVHSCFVQALDEETERVQEQGRLVEVEISACKREHSRTTEQIEQRKLVLERLRRDAERAEAISASTLEKSGLLQVQITTP